MQRAAVLWRASPARVVAALFALMLAAAMAVGSGANFNATSANPGNVVTAGVLDHSNSKDGSAILAVNDIVPGETQSGTVTLTNTGNVDGEFSVSAANMVDTPGTGGGDLSDVLTLDIVDVTAGVTRYSGTLDGASAEALGTWAAGSAHNFRFDVTMADGGPNGADNAYQGSSVAIDFEWESVSDSTP